MIDRNTRWLAVLAGVSFAALAAQPVFAQTAADTTTASAAADDDIIVTATKRDSRLQDVPFSINAQTQADIQRSGATTLEDISRNVAGLTIQNLGPGQSQVSIRGVSAGQIVRDQPGVKEQVGIYLDESVISLSLFTPDLDLFDLNRIETLRGPQGTLFGSGSVGGTIRYITNQPVIGKTEGLAEGDVNFVDGGDVGGSLKGAVNIPINDKLAARAVGYYTHYSGFIDAVGPAGGKNVNDGDRYGGRIALLFQPTEDIKITPRVVYQKIDTGGFNREEVFNLYGNPFTTTRGVVPTRDRQQYLLLREKFRDETLIADLTASADFGGVLATSVSTYTDRNILVSRDASALTGSVSIDLGYPVAGVLLPSNLRDTTKVKSYTQELRLASTGDGPFQWVIGGFYSDTDRKYDQRLPTPGYDVFTDARFGAGTSVAVANGFPLDSPYNASLPYNIKQYAAFGEASYRLWEKLTATAGLRYYNFKEKRDFISGGLFSNSDTRIDDRTKSDGVSPRFLLSYKASDAVTVNAQASKGFRLGGVNDPLNIPLCSGGAGGVDALTYGNRPRYGDETLWNYEAGIKTQGRGFTFNAAAFYTDIKNLQVTADAGSCSSRVVFNVPKAHTVGIEGELSARPLENLQVGVSGSYIDSKFDRSVTTTTGVVIAGIRDGNRLPTVPKFQISANASYTVPLGTASNLVFNGSVQHVGSRYTQPSDQEGNPRSFVSGLAFGGATGTEVTLLNLKLPSYQLVNLSVVYEIESGFSLTGYIANVTDENARLSFDRERGGRARLAFTTNTPRTFGVTVRKAF